MLNILKRSSLCKGHFCFISCRFWHVLMFGSKVSLYYVYLHFSQPLFNFVTYCQRVNLFLFTCKIVTSELFFACQCKESANTNNYSFVFKCNFCSREPLIVDLSSNPTFKQHNNTSCLLCFLGGS